MMETYPKIQTLFKRDMDGSLTGKKGKMMPGKWTTPELEYLAGNQWEFTEKVDGTNIRIGYNQIKDAGRPGEWGVSREVEFGGRRENAVIPKSLLAYLEETFTPERFVEAGFPLQDPEYSLVLFGEGYGPKIQNGGNYRDDIAFVLFDVKIGDWWLNRESVDDIAAKLGIESVPVIGHGTLQDAIDIVSSGLTWDANGKMTNWSINPNVPEGYLGRVREDRRQFRGLKSQWGNFEAEGIVARPAVPMFDRKGQRIITKIKGVDFK